MSLKCEGLKARHGVLGGRTDRRRTHHRFVTPKIVDDWLAWSPSWLYNDRDSFDENVNVPMRLMTQLTFALPEESLAPEDLRHNKLKDADLAFHDRYRFVLSSPSCLVCDYFSQFELTPGHLQLSP